jgi:hypothetical protein
MEYLLNWVMKLKNNNAIQNSKLNIYTVFWMIIPRFIISSMHTAFSLAGGESGKKGEEVSSLFPCCVYSNKNISLCFMDLPFML